jgi:hypothetical protein
MEKQRIDNKVKRFYNSLLKDGYYLRPEKYENCTLVQLTKDLPPVNCSAARKTVYEFNLTTAKQLSEMFGFKFKNETSYFGKAEPVKTGMKRGFFNS